MSMNKMDSVILVVCAWFIPCVPVTFGIEQDSTAILLTSINVKTGMVE